MSEFEKDDYFKIDPEPHLVGDMELVKHFPGVQMWWRAIDAIHRPLITGTPLEAYIGVEEWETQKITDPANIIRAMDKYGVDIACLLPESMMDTTGYTSRWCTNGEMAKVVESNPDRFMYQ
nr:amidohydrolase [Desulfobacteraceae bacterium]